MNKADQDLENRIEATMQAVYKAKTRQEKLGRYYEAKALIEQRSPAQIERMEIAKGLR